MIVRLLKGAGNFICLSHHAGGFEKLDVAHQIKEAFEYMERTLKKAGSNIKDVVQINLYLRDFSDARDVFVEVFGDNAPARMTTTTAFFDKECLVMIDGVAYIDD